MENWSENGHNTRAVQATMVLAFRQPFSACDARNAVQHPGHCVLLTRSPLPSPAVVPTTDASRHSDCDTDLGFVTPGE